MQIVKNTLVSILPPALLLTSFASGLARADLLLDQQQPVIDTTVGGLALGGASQQQLAQVVTAGISGALTEIRLPVACDSGNLVLEIQAVTGGEPSGLVLTSQTIPGASLPAFGGVVSLRSLVLSTPVTISAGTQFAITLSSSGECGLFQGPVGDSYSAGNAFFQAAPNPPGWVCMCDFPGSRLDLPFETFVDVALQVGIDIKPGDAENSINSSSHGKLPVAILSGPAFDAPGQVDTASLTFGRTGNEASLEFCNGGGEDVNGDGLPDLVCHFDTQASGFLPGDAQGVLKGKLSGGGAFVGKDSVLIVR